MADRIKEIISDLVRRHGGFYRFPGRLALVLGVAVLLAVWIFGETGRIWPYRGESPRGVPFDVVRVSRIADLKSVYEKRGAELDAVAAGEAAVPPLVLAGLPEDLGTDLPTDERKAAFIASVLPSVLIVNREILLRRLRLQRVLEARVLGRDLSQEDSDWLAEMAEAYGTEPDKPAALRLRIDVVPVSLAIAQAAVESGWGSARFAQEGTALYGIHGHNGEAALEADAADGLYLRGYDTVLGSVRDYARLLNSHAAYAGFRKLRAQRRAAGLAPSGAVLAGTLTSYSERDQAYVKTLRQVIRDNQLGRLDAVRLEEDVPAKGES